MPLKVARLTTLILLLSACNCAFAVKSLKLNIPKDQAIVVQVPPDQWVQKETSWIGGVPISILRADRNFVTGKGWQNGSLPLLETFHIDKAQDCGSGVMSGRIVGCPVNWKQIELRSSRAWLKIQLAPELVDVEAALKRASLLWIGLSI